jgi:hypothetical protein
LTDYPLAFRAGAVGPDNMVFPGMTDPSHALGQRPFEQCELLYQAAVVPEERAYALGCFLHGSTDAVAHHYVNYMTGETFTLTPITSARQDSLDNVVRHILAESQLQRAAVEQDPDAFASSKLLHTIPIGFVLRTYLDQDSALWQMMAAHAKAEYDAAVLADPDAALPTLVASLDVAPADHLVLTPVYLATIDTMIADTRVDLEARVAEMQDWNTPEGAALHVTPGDDGTLGTKDDETDCSASCPELFATYFTYAGLLAPRYNAQQQELPPAFDKITEQLRVEMFKFHEAYMQTVANLSAKLNEAPNDMSGEFGATKADIEAAFAPLKQWSDNITTIDYDTLVYAVVPDWLIELDTFMQAFGVDIDLAAIFKAIFDPIVQPIKDAIQDAFIAQAQVFIQTLVDEIEAKKAPIYAEYDARLAAAADPALSGDMLDHFHDSGLFGHAFNIAAVAIADHRAVLPVGDDPIGVGPASFDASYTPAWMQAGVCDYLREVVFPLGIDARGALSVRDGNGDFPAVIDVDSPVECHAGSLSAFAGDPDAAACLIVKLAALLGDPVGSLSRAYPPNLSEKPAQCEHFEVPGLPAPPPVQRRHRQLRRRRHRAPATRLAAPARQRRDRRRPDRRRPDRPDPAPTAPSRDRSRGDRRRRLRLHEHPPEPPRPRPAAPPRPRPSPPPRRPGDERHPRGRLRRQRRDDDTTTTQPTLARDHVHDHEPDRRRHHRRDHLHDHRHHRPPTTRPPRHRHHRPHHRRSDDHDRPDHDRRIDGRRIARRPQRHRVVRRGDPRRQDPRLRAALRHRLPAVVRAAQPVRPVAPARDAGHEGRPRRPERPHHRHPAARLGGPPRERPRGRLDPRGPRRRPPHPPHHPRRPGRGVHGGPVARPHRRPHRHRPRLQGRRRRRRGLLRLGRQRLRLHHRLQLRPRHVRRDRRHRRRRRRPLHTWTDPSQNNQYSVNDVDGFDQLGGTTLTDTFNFFVTYTGTVTHPGGDLAMREANDSVEDAVWVFLGDAAGTGQEMDLFLEVQGFAWPDETSDEPSASFPAGDVPIEAILVRCTESIADVDVQIQVPPNDWTLVGDAPTVPVINTTLFPPAL